MSPFPVHIKHAAKVYDVQLDPDLPPGAFKEAIYQVTGIPVDRMKVMIKGGVLKDDTSWKKVAPKAGQTFIVIGAAGELPKPPEKPTVFLEDMDDSELASAIAKPVGLVNLGNTCYMNSSIQALRAIPELQVAFAAAGSTAPGSSSTSATLSPSSLPLALQALYTSMSQTTSSITPSVFLGVLRQVNPQFAERDRTEKSAMAASMGIGSGYAQQDAEECYAQIVNSLRELPGLPPTSLIKLPVAGSGDAMQVDQPAGAGSSQTAQPPSTPNKKFVEQWLMGEMRRELSCDEAPEEPKSISHENVLKVECNITINTNYMMSGIMSSLDQKVSKRSPTLGREASYTQRSRMTRLPTYLTIHMVRFAWRADIGKKAKIMRKVKFPTELDALDLVTEELKTRMLPVNRKLLEFARERADRHKQRKRTKAKVEAAQPAPGSQTESVVSEAPAAEVPVGELEDEIVYRRREADDLEKLLDADIKADTGACASGLYDLVAIVTHKGAAADSGHYIGFVKKSVFRSPASDYDDEDEDWYKFDDDKVSVFPKEKLATLDGGGEDSSAYVLLYKAKPLV